MYTPIKITLLAHQGLPEKEKQKFAKRLTERFIDFHFEFHDESPDFIYFVAGGSEQFALEHLNPSRLNLLVAFSRDNAYASATEVMAYARSNNLPARLLCLDDPQDVQQFIAFVKVLQDLEPLRGCRAALIGKPSPWLVASGIPFGLLKERLGLHVIQLSWEEVGDFQDQESDAAFIRKYGADPFPGLEDASRVNNLLKKSIEKYDLKAVTVECFPLVQEQHVTACLSLSDLNDRGIVAACEGDLASMTGMILCQAVTGMIPWMANVASITGNRLLLAHCTAPTSLLSGFSVDTHFETGKGTAVKGSLQGDEVTLFRVDSKLENIFLARGKVVERPGHPFACRTQIEVELSEGDTRSLKDNPLGNHHLVLPGDFRSPLRTLAALLLLKPVNLFD